VEVPRLDPRSVRAVTVEQVTGRPAESIEEFVARRRDLFGA
jgi:hypothetical protein